MSCDRFLPRPLTALSHPASLNDTATLLNAFQRMVDLNLILTRRSKAKKSIPLMALHPEWVPTRTQDGSIEAEGQLWTFVERLSRFRREGKK